MLDHYKTLEVEKTASPAEIKAAFRKLARRYHPDTNKDNPAAEKKFKEISQAYDVLSDVKKRAEYDNPASRFTPGNGFGGFNDGAVHVDFHDLSGIDSFHDIFSDLFSRHGDPRPKKTPIELPLTLQEAIYGTTRTIRLNNGSNQSVTFPPGLSDGLTFQQNNLLFHISVIPHPNWKLVDRDLYADLDIPDYTAVLGGEALTSLPNGKNISLKVAPGSNSGKVMRLRGKGLPALGEFPVGDLLLRLNVMVPTNPSESVRKFYEQIKEALTLGHSTV